MLARPTPARLAAASHSPLLSERALPIATRRSVPCPAPTRPSLRVAPRRRPTGAALAFMCGPAQRPDDGTRPAPPHYPARANQAALSLALFSVAAVGLPGAALDAGGVDVGGSGGGGKGGTGGGGGGGGGGSDGPSSSSSSTSPPPAAAEGAADDEAAPTDVLVLDVGGMHCAGCAATVRRILEGERSSAGVRGASVNAATEAGLVRVALPPAVIGSGPAAVSAHLSGVGAYLAGVLGGRGFPSSVREAGEGGGRGGSLTAAARAAGAKRAAREAALAAAGRDLALAALLGGACAVGHVACCIPGLPNHLRRFGDPRLMAALSGLALLGPGRPVLEKGFASAGHGRPDMNTLVGLGASATYAVSTAAYFLPSLGWPTYFEEPAMLLGAVLAGRALEARAKLRATADSAALYALLPATARLVVGPAAARLAAALEAEAEDGSEGGAQHRRRRGLRGLLFSRSPPRVSAAAAASTALAAGGWRDVPADAVAPGDVVAILPGDLIPVDGTVVGGRSAVDEAALAGEPLPATKARGSRVAAGTSNCEGSLLVRAARVGGATTIADVVAAVEAAQARAPSIQRAADAVAGTFAVGVLGVAGGTALFWGCLGPRLFPAALAKAAPPSVAAALARGSGSALAGVPAAAALLGLQMACNVLVVACPCAVGLAAPTAVLVGTAAGARRGLLVRGGDVLEAAAAVDTVILDKTGTLTRGVPTVAAVLAVAKPAAGGRRRRGRMAAAPPPAELLALAAAVEAHSAHPVAKAVVAAAAAGAAGSPSSKYTADAASITQEAGSGVAGTVGGRAVRVGNWGWVGRALRDGPGSGHPPRLEGGGDQQHEPSTPAPRAMAYVSVDGVLAGAFAVEDELRPDAAATVAALLAAGVRPLLVSGDAPGPVAAVAAAVGIPPSDAAASIKPRGKAAIVARLQAAGHRVAMVGDGVNDAAALAAADCGVAMGGGSGGAVEAASIVLLGDRLPSLPDALHLARATLAKVHQNLGWALAYNAVAIPLAAGAALPTRLGWALTPAASGLMMGASSLAVMANSLSLRKWGVVDAAGGGCAAPALPSPATVAGGLERCGAAWAAGLEGWLSGGGVGRAGEAADQGV